MIDLWLDMQRLCGSISCSLQREKKVPPSALCFKYLIAGGRILNFDPALFLLLLVTSLFLLILCLHSSKDTNYNFSEREQQINPDPVGVKYCILLPLMGWSSFFSPGLLTLPVNLWFTKLLAHPWLCSGLWHLKVRVCRVVAAHCQTIKVQETEVTHRSDRMVNICVIYRYRFIVYTRDGNVKEVPYTIIGN